MEKSTSNSKVGVFVDVANLYRSGGQRLRYDVLREFARRDGADPIRLNAYVSYDRLRADDDQEYKRRTQSFHAALRELGYKVIVKPVSVYMDEGGNRVTNTHTDLEMAVDILLQSENLDRILIASGDGGFVRLVRSIQDKGLRVEVVALENSSNDLRFEADLFLSGYLIPDLIPISGDRQQTWGEVGSRVRGWCYWHHRTEMYGFMRFLKAIAPGLWLSDTRHPNSPYGTAFFHDSNLPYEVVSEDLPNRDLLFEFKLIDAERQDGLQAVEIQIVGQL
jgi:uncharacterized LabA/DUF88 family protein